MNWGCGGEQWWGGDLIKDALLRGWRRGQKRGGAAEIECHAPTEREVGTIATRDTSSTPPRGHLIREGRVTAATACPPHPPSHPVIFMTGAVICQPASSTRRTIPSNARAYGPLREGTAGERVWSSSATTHEWKRTPASVGVAGTPAPEAPSAATAGGVPSATAGEPFEKMGAHGGGDTAAEGLTKSADESTSRFRRATTSSAEPRRIVLTTSLHIRFMRWSNARCCSTDTAWVITSRQRRGTIGTGGCWRCQHDSDEMA